MLYKAGKNETLRKEKKMKDLIIITKGVGIIFATLVMATLNFPIL